MNFRESIKYTIMIQRISGFAQFSCETVNNTLKVSLCSKIYSILLLCVYFILFFIGTIFSKSDTFEDFTQEGNSTTYLSGTILFSDVIITNLFFLIIQLTAIFNINEHLLFLNNINEIDKILSRNFKFSINYKKHLRLNIFGIFIMFTVFILLSENFITLFLSNDFVVLAIAITVIVQIFCRLVAIFTYVNYVCLIYFRYSFLMEIIRKSLYKKNSECQQQQEQTLLVSTSIVNNRTDDTADNKKRFQILICCYLFCDLYKTICIFNKAFGRIILLILFHTFTLTFTQSFLIVMHLATEKIINIRFVYFGIFWILHDVVKFVLSTFSTQFTIDKVSNGN